MRRLRGCVHINAGTALLLNVACPKGSTSSAGQGKEDASSGHKIKSHASRAESKSRIHISRRSQLLEHHDLRSIRAPLLADKVLLFGRRELLQLEITLMVAGTCPVSIVEEEEDRADKGDGIERQREEVLDNT